MSKTYTDTNLKLSYKAVFTSCVQQDQALHEREHYYKNICHEYLYSIVILTQLRKI